MFTDKFNKETYKKIPSTFVWKLDTKNSIIDMPTFSKSINKDNNVPVNNSPEQPIYDEEIFNFDSGLQAFGLKAKKTSLEKEIDRIFSKEEQYKSYIKECNNIVEHDNDLIETLPCDQTVIIDEKEIKNNVDRVKTIIEVEEVIFNAEPFVEEESKIDSFISNIVVKEKDSKTIVKQLETFISDPVLNKQIIVKNTETIIEKPKEVIFNAEPIIRIEEEPLVEEKEEKIDVEQVEELKTNDDYIYFFETQTNECVISKESLDVLHLTKKEILLQSKGIGFETRTKWKREVLLNFYLTCYCDIKKLGVYNNNGFLSKSEDIIVINRDDLKTILSLNKKGLETMIKNTDNMTLNKKDKKAQLQYQLIVFNK